MMREKRRYILVKTSSSIGEGPTREFELGLYSELLRCIGEVSYFRANPKIVKFIGADSFILKCSLVKYRDTLAALTLIKMVSGKDIGFYTLKSSGTISALMKPS